jgi:hypothetical protein
VSSRTTNGAMHHHYKQHCTEKATGMSEVRRLKTNVALTLPACFFHQVTPYGELSFIPYTDNKKCEVVSVVN